MTPREEVLARIRRANEAARAGPAASAGGARTAARAPRAAGGGTAGGGTAGGGTAGGGTAGGGTAGGGTAGGGTAGYRTAGDRDQAELLDLLAERLTDYRATVRRTTAGLLAGEVAAALARRDARRIVVPAGLDVFGPAGPPDGLEVITDESPPDAGVPDGGALDGGALDGCDGAVTGAAVAIAETGTIVLDTGPGQGRRAITLVPDYHLCIVRADQVVELVPEAVARLFGAATRPLTWISGPSATSDIELDRVEGVHGPRTLEVILVEP